MPRSRHHQREEPESQYEEEQVSVEEDTGSEPSEGGVMEDSGQTEEERRQIRQQQRALLKDLQEKDSLGVEEARDRNNDIFHSVRYTREAVLDGENLISIANKASRLVDGLVQVPRYDADRLIDKLTERIREASRATGQRSNQFNWNILGEAAGACFNALPSGVCYLQGPLLNGRPPVTRTRTVQRRRQATDDAVEQRPEDVKTHTERDDNKLSATEQSMKDMSKVLTDKVNARYNENKRRLQELHNNDIPAPVSKKLKKHGVDIDAWQFLLNPNSFTQSVENIFHYSFLIKKGAAALSVRHESLDIDGVTADPGMVLKYVKESRQPPPAKQGILAFTMKDWRDLCELHQVEKGDLPERRIHKNVMPSQSQASVDSS